MRMVRTVLIVFMAITGALVTHAASAHGSRVHFGLAIGGPAFWYYPAPYYYYPPPYYYPPVATVPATPPVYVERSDQSAERPASYWYYCRDTKTYYPYVKECASPWQRVEPRPPG